jgi:hypothetical protein
VARLIASGMVIDFGDATMDDPQPRPLQVMGQVQRLDGGGSCNGLRYSPAKVESLWNKMGACGLI